MNLDKYIPALYYLGWSGDTLEKPQYCHNCPFAIESDRDEEKPNPADRAEGYYNCAILKEKMWGENPKCEDRHWQEIIRNEVRKIANYETQRLINRQELINGLKENTDTIAKVIPNLSQYDVQVFLNEFIQYLDRSDESGTPK